MKIPGALFRTLILAVVALIVLASTSCGSSEDQSQTIVLYGFSILENVMRDEVIPAFQEYWRREEGQAVQVITSFAGSGTVTNQIILGAPAQVAMVATELDALNIKKAGLVSTDWTEFENRGTFAHSVAVILTRGGNPKGLYSFEDLTSEGVKVVLPDPTTSGGAQWAVLALYGSALNIGDAAAGGDAHTSAKELLKGVRSNAGSLPESARRALTQFSLGYGDALLTYENEALLDISKGSDYEIVIPKSTIYIQPKVLIIDSNVDESDRAVVEAFVQFLWSEKAQKALVRNNFRVPNEKLMGEHPQRYGRVELPFTVDQLGGWEEATFKIIDQVWAQVR